MGKLKREVRPMPQPLERLFFFESIKRFPH